jgi:hypothetical protein
MKVPAFTPAGTLHLPTPAFCPTDTPEVIYHEFSNLIPPIPIPLHTMQSVQEFLYVEIIKFGLLYCQALYSISALEMSFTRADLIAYYQEQPILVQL